MDTDLVEHSIITHLQQAHAAERAQIGELRALRDEIGLPTVADLIEQHRAETDHHGAALEHRLQELGSRPSVRLVAQAVGGALPKLIVDHVRPHSACAALRDAVIAEAGEIASYILLESEALRGGDESTAVLAAELRASEVAMRDQLMGFWPLAVAHDLADQSGNGIATTRDVQARIIDHLRDIHALERNAAMMLSTVSATVHDPVAHERVGDHRTATVRHGDEVALRLRELGSGPSVRKQAQGLAFALVKGPVNLVRAERAAKDLRDMYVVEHLELVSYAQLAELAEIAGDDKTRQLALSQGAEEASMADWLERDAARFLLETLAAKA